MKQINNIIRGSIWMCDMSIYKSKIKHLQNGLRPVLIISNDTCNINSPVIQVIPLTTKFKNNLLTHVILDKEYGLRQRSIALIEAITSIEIDCLKYKIGFIDEDKMVEIENSIKIQHGFTEIFNEKYLFNLLENLLSIQNNNENKELEIILNEKLINYINKNRAELEELIINKRNIIKDFYNNGSYRICIKYCIKIYDLISLLNNEKNSHYKYDKWFYCFRIGMCYLKLKEYEKSINYAYKSMEHTDKYDDTKYLECLWLLGRCYTNLNNKEKALENYNICIKFYKELCLNEYLADVTYNKGLILKDYKIIEEALKIRLEGNFKSNENVLDIYYKTLVELYSEKDTTKAMEYFNKIINNEIKEKLLKNYIKKDGE